MHAVRDRILGDLVDTVGPGGVITDRVAAEEYRWDRARDPGAGRPLAVVMPRTTAEVQKIVRIAASAAVPIVPRGAGSGLSGGSSATDGGIVVSLERMTAVSVEPDTRIAVVEPGAMNADVKRAAAAHGLWYPPDPASYEFCSIGGNVATNAGGLCCVKYGVTADYVLGMTVVLADGRAVRLGGPRLKDAAGLSLTRLFVGSEGTLGIITEIVLRLIPAQRPPHTLTASFPTLAGAGEAIMAIAGALRPSMLEFMDRASINAVEDDMAKGLDRTAAGMLVVQVDESPVDAAAHMQLIAEICARHGAAQCAWTDDPVEGEAFVIARRGAIPAVERKGDLLLGDVGVPVHAIRDLVDGIDRIATSHELTIAVIAHAGDGNTHPMVVLDAADSGQRARADRAYGEVMDLAIALGGTITGEHGVGRLKAPWLPAYLGDDALELNCRIKQALDPDDILNPGAVYGATWSTR